MKAIVTQKFKEQSFKYGLLIGLLLYPVNYIVYMEFD